MVRESYAKQILYQLLLQSSNEWFKRGLLQYAVSIGVIEHQKWRQLLTEYCPKYAKSKRFGLG